MYQQTIWLSLKIILREKERGGERKWREGERGGERKWRKGERNNLKEKKEKKGKERVRRRRKGYL